MSSKIVLWLVAVLTGLLLLSFTVAAAQEQVFLPVSYGEVGNVQADEETGITRVPVSAPEVEREYPSDMEVEENLDVLIADLRPESQLQDTDGLYAMPPLVEAASIDAYDDPGDFTVGGKLGVGTETPSYKADVIYNANDAARIRVQNTNAGGNAWADIAITTGNSGGFALQKFGANFSSFYWSGRSLAEWARFRSDSGVAGLIFTTGGPSPLVFGTNDLERMRITPDGRLAIGTDIPSDLSRITVSGGGTAGYAMVMQDSSGLLIASSGRSGVHINSPSWNGIYVSSPAYNGVEVSNAGDDGIHIYNPGDHGFYVYSPGGDGLYVSSPATHGVEIHNPVYHGFYIANTGAHGGHIYQAGAHGLWIEAPGLDGINVLYPGDNGLDVYYASYTGKAGVHVWNGDIVTNGGAFIDTGVTLNVPDYVFEDDYSMMPLDELREYVELHKHLPNVASLDEIKAEGVNLGAFNMTLLEKVEELTLYTLDQDMQIEMLMAENADLAARLSAFEDNAATQ